jgi:hypothetical protein
VRRAALALSAALVLALAVAACGGGGSESSTPPAEAELSPATVKAADAICVKFRHELVAVAHSALKNAPRTTILELTTQRLVKPLIPLLEKTAAELRALQKEGSDPSFELFVNLFDPGIVLGEKRVEAGEEGDIARSHGLEAQLANLSETQRRAAADAGLAACSIDFSHLLVSSVGR